MQPKINLAQAISMGMTSWLQINGLPEIIAQAVDMWHQANPNAPRRKVVFATPTFTQKTAYEFTGSMEQAVTLCALNGIGSYHRFWPGLQFVEVARNFLVTQFLDECPDATDLFFIDDDVGFPAGKVIEFLNRPEDIVAGVPPMKQDSPSEYPVFLKLEDGQLQQRDGLYRAFLVPAGFLRIKRHVLETLARQAKTYSMVEKGGALKVCFDIFDRGPRHGEFVGEDAMFCDKAEKAGFQIWVDPDIEFHHRGVKRWEGRFLDQLNTYMSREKAEAEMLELHRAGTQAIKVVETPEQVEAAQ